MLEDKLTAEQRLRLESFAQAVSVKRLLDGSERPRLENIFDIAECIEAWLKKA